MLNSSLELHESNFIHVFLSSSNFLFGEKLSRLRLEQQYTTTICHYRIECMCSRPALGDREWFLGFVIMLLFGNNPVEVPCEVTTCESTHVVFKRFWHTLLVNLADGFPGNCFVLE